jgi:hypothetical protein
MSLFVRQRNEAPPATVRPAPRHLPETLCAALFVAGLALFWLPLREVELAAMSGYGLISVLPVATLAGAALLVVTFFLTLGLDRPHRTLLGAQLAGLVVTLHGLAPGLEELARPSTAWQHLGFVEYLTRTGRPDVLLDARYSWPGFFAGVGFVTRAAGIDDLEPLMHWSPVALQLLYLAAYFLILRGMRANWRATWFAAWLLITADWVGQDYFAPQGLGFAFYLLFVGILVNWFMPVEPGHRVPGELPSEDPGTRERVVVLFVLLGVFGSTVASHQLTPHVMVFAATALVLVRRCSLRGLPILTAVLVMGWISYLTKAYWSGRTDDLFSEIGSLFDTLHTSVGGRVAQGSAELALIQQTRIAIAVLLVTLALLGLARRRRLRFDDRVAAVLLGVPFLTIALQNYGGEITLRVYLFILPGACLLVAYLFFPTASAAARPVRAVGAAGLCGLLIAGLFLFVRFGNENFERVRPGEVQAFETMLATFPTGRINLVWQAGRKGPIAGYPVAPWGLRAQERWDYTEIAATPDDPADLRPILAALKARPGGCFLTTRSNESYNRYTFGLAPDYATRMVQALSASPELVRIHHDADADVFALRTQPAGAVPAVRAPVRFDLGMTAWTPVGILATLLLVILLVAGEIFRLRGRPFPRTLSRAVWPLLAVCVLVVFERFSTLGS